MTSLEFIEKEIENIKYLFECDDVLCLKTDKDYKFWNNRLQTLQQIKTELEALEVVKEELQIIDKTTNQYGEPLYRYELNVVGQDKINTLEKGISKKVEIRQRNSLSEPYFVCPTCNKRLDEENEYCPYCKQKLDYSSYYGDEDEQ